MKPSSRLFWVLTLGLNAVGCGGGKQPDAPPIEQQTSADEILRIGTIWTATLPDQGILSPPSAISVYKNVRSSQITLSKERATELLVIEENLQLRSGAEIKCSTAFEHSLGLRFGRRQGEPAVELVRPALSGRRECSGVHPEGSFEEPARRALFVLRSDQLVPVEPPLEKRNYIPQAL
jgi:hypothetical protein